MINLYIEITVWKWTSEEEAIKFNCLQRMDTGEFNVQSADFFRATSSLPQAYFEKNFVDLFLGLNPSQRANWHKSLEDAISAHERHFAD